MNAKRFAMLATGALLWLAGPWAGPAHALVAPWETTPGVGPSQVVYTLDLICTDPGLVCGALDAYSDVQTADLVGSGEIDIDLTTGTLQFLTDGVVDLFDGMGPRLTYNRGVASDLLFAPIPFIGAPQTESGAVFGLTDPIFDAGGALVPGAYPISAVVSYSAIADIVGPVDAYLPVLLLPPDDVTLSGTLQVLGVLPEGIFYEMRDMTASINVQNPTTLLGENVTVSVTADLTLNLSGVVGGANIPPTVVPGLGDFGFAALVAALGLAGARATRNRSRSEAQERRNR